MTVIKESTSDRKITHYECTNSKCEAKDKDNGFNPPAPIDLICHKCRNLMRVTHVEHPNSQ